MADSKITALTALTAADPANDMLPVVDVSDTSMAASGTTKRISINNILACSPSATLASATITGDLTVDTSTLKVDSTNNRVGIGTASPTVPLDVVGSGLISTGLVVGTSATNNAIDIVGPASGANAGSQLSFKNGATTNAAIGNYSRVIGGAYNESLAFYSNSKDFVFYSGAERYRIASDGVATWSNVGGVAGTAMTLNATGLGVGGSPNYKLNLTGAGSSFASSPSLALYDTTVGSPNSRNWLIGNVAANNYGELVFCVSSAAGGAPTNVQMTLNSSGNVGIGVTPSAWATYKAVSVGGIGASVFGLGSSQAGVAQGAFFNNGAGSGWAYSATSQVPTYYLQINGENIWNIAASGTAGAQITAWTPAMKLDANGNLILQSSATPATLATNGQLTVNATSNTNLRFSYRGSDGVTRTANLTLA